MEVEAIFLPRVLSAREATRARNYSATGDTHQSLSKRSLRSSMQSRNESREKLGVAYWDGLADTRPMLRRSPRDVASPRASTCTLSLRASRRQLVESRMGRNLSISREFYGFASAEPDNTPRGLSSAANITAALSPRVSGADEFGSRRRAAEAAAAAAAATRGKTAEEYHRARTPAHTPFVLPDVSMLGPLPTSFAAAAASARAACPEQAAAEAAAPTRALYASASSRRAIPAREHHPPVQRLSARASLEGLHPTPPMSRRASAAGLFERQEHMAREALTAERRLSLHRLAATRSRLETVRRSNERERMSRGTGPGNGRLDPTSPRVVNQAVRRAPLEWRTQPHSPRKRL